MLRWAALCKSGGLRLLSSQGDNSGGAAYSYARRLLGIKIAISCRMGAFDEYHVSTVARGTACTSICCTLLETTTAAHHTTPHTHTTHCTLRTAHCLLRCHAEGTMMHSDGTQQLVCRHRLPLRPFRNLFVRFRAARPTQTHARPHSRGRQNNRHARRCSRFLICTQHAAGCVRGLAAGAAAVGGSTTTTTTSTNGLARRTLGGADDGRSQPCPFYALFGRGKYELAYGRRLAAQSRHALPDEWGPRSIRHCG